MRGCDTTNKEGAGDKKENKMCISGAKLFFIEKWKWTHLELRNKKNDRLSASTSKVTSYLPVEEFFEKKAQ